MSKLYRIALYEYQRNVFKRSFLLALLSVPLMIGLMVGVGFVMESLNNDNSPVGYVDHAGLFADPVPVPVTGSKRPVDFVAFQAEEDARAALEAGDIQAFYVVDADYHMTRDVGLFYLKEPGRNATRQFYDFIQINLLDDQPPDIARRAALLGESVTVRSLDGRRQVTGGGPTFGIIMPLLVGFAFLFLLLMSSGYLGQAVAEEKENRIMEILTTSVSPMQLIGGKVLGIVAISFTQLLAWILVSVLAIVIARQAGIEWFRNPSMDWGTTLATVTLAIPSYILASALMTTIGATMSSAHESQSTGVLVFVLFASPLWFGWAMVDTPDAALPLTLSFLPFTSFMTITVRNIFGVVPSWQVAASVAIQTVSAVGALWLASRAFRLGMLRYGQRLNLREILGRGDKTPAQGLSLRQHGSQGEI
jgi:ABC-2 type transport system permease protein